MSGNSLLKHVSQEKYKLHQWSILTLRSMKIGFNQIRFCLNCNRCLKCEKFVKPLQLHSKICSLISQTHMLAIAHRLHIIQAIVLTLTVKLKCDRPSFRQLVCDRFLLVVYALFVQPIACPHHSYFIALQCIAYLFARSRPFVRNRRIGDRRGGDRGGARSHD